VDGWYRYYAGFPSTFVEQVLRHYACTARAIVLDPWNGCGTTTYVARNLGFLSIGLDLNPFASYVATAKLICYEDGEEIHDILESAIQVSPHRRNRDIVKDDPLLEWLEPETATQVRSIVDAMTRTTLTRSVPYPPAPQFCFALLCLIRALRDMGLYKRVSNPSWTIPGKRLAVSIDELRRAWHEVASHCLCDVVRCQEPLPESTVLIGDSRRLPLNDGSVDLVITSPPYCTRIDDAVKTKFELAVMGLGSKGKFAELRRQLMGTTTIRLKKRMKIPDSWAPLVRDTLKQIFSHPSHASSNYYFKNLWQYFDDAHQSLAELHRVLKPGGRAIIVLRTSYYKEISLELPDLYLDMANCCSMRGDKLYTSEVPASFATINRGGTTIRQGACLS
jgi:DNA modification methylase